MYVAVIGNETDTMGTRVFAELVEQGEDMYKGWLNDYGDILNQRDNAG